MLAARESRNAEASKIVFMLPNKHLEFKIWVEVHHQFSFSQVSLANIISPRLNMIVSRLLINVVHLLGDRSTHRLR